MFSGGIGSMEAEHVSKEPPESGESPPAFPRPSQLSLQHVADAEGNREDAPMVGF